MRLGRFDLSIVSDGAFRLDGGAMFGVVPRTLWETAEAGRREEPDPASGTNAC